MNLRYLFSTTPGGLRLYLSLAILVAAAVALASSLGDLLPLAVQTYLFYLLLVVGLQTFVGNSGVLSFGHVGFTAIGAYTAAILTIPVAEKELRLREMPPFLLNLQIDPVIAVVAAAAVAGVAALIVGVPILRLGGLSAAIATFALLVIVHVVAINLVPVTNGRSGLTGIPVSLGTPGVAAWVLVALAAAVAFQRTTLGLRLRAAREDEIAARAAGIGVFRERLVAWVVSAMIVGAGGAVYAEFITTFSPDAFYLSLTFVIVAMLVVGGVTSITGAVVGALFLALLNESLRAVQGGLDFGPLALPPITGLQQFGVALITLIVLVLRPGGLTKGRELDAMAVRLRSWASRSEAP